MLMNSASWTTVLLLTLACSRSGEAPQIPKRQYPTVDSQTSGETPVQGEPAKPTTSKPAPIAAPRTQPQTSGTSASASATAGAGATANANATAINRADISGWWLSPQDASPTQDRSFGIGTNGIKCQAFTLINEDKLKVAKGWECWDYSQNVETFHVARLGDIIGIDNGLLVYKATAGCDQANLHTNQSFTFAKGTASNGKRSLTIATETAANLTLNKITPGPTAEGWIVLPVATNWTVRVGCLDGSGNFSNAPSFNADQLFSFSN
ncbi:MAG: hypothetical protein FJ146_06180 [Deltaproteobacteria bacterium]|nr:hypothetical protein [Deltaproteobacteria bacterium]